MERIATIDTGKMDKDITYENDNYGNVVRTVRLQILSDLHLEHCTDFPRIVPQCDHLCLAGDIGNVSTFASAQLLQSFLAYCCAHWKHVYYVLGNHEWYCPPDVPFLEMYEAMFAQFPNLHWLNDSYVDMVPGKLRIYGTTFWTANQTTYCPSEIRDRQPELIQLAEEQQRNLKKYLKWGCATSTIVMTHFPPLQRGTSAPKYLTEPQNLQNYFAHDNFHQEFADTAPLVPLWISGHTHHSYFIHRDGFNFAANQYCYPEERVAGQSNFAPNKVYPVKYYDLSWTTYLEGKK